MVAPGKLVYTFASSAARVEDGRTCVEGMKLLAERLHPLGIRITWLVSAESARLTAELLTTWHREHGDAIAVHAPKMALELAYEEKLAILRREKAGVEAALPWAETTVAAHGHNHEDMPRLCAELGYVGLWGLCWEQIETDKFWDRGMPWGFYYMDPDHRLRPHGGERGVIGMEWTSRDLLKSFHSGAPTLFSLDPNDVARAWICRWDEIDYWKRGLADNYLRNTRWNDFVFMMHHQEAHEMEAGLGAAFNIYTAEDVREAMGMLEAYVVYLKEQAGDRLAVMTLPEAARLYRERYEKTAAQYMLFEDVPTPPFNPHYGFNVARGPWPRTFLYYDRECQMMFVEGRVEPVCIRDYGLDPARYPYFAQPAMPRVKLLADHIDRYRRELRLQVESPAAMPCGVALWGDWAHYRIAEAPGMVEGKILPHELLFACYRLEEGTQEIRIALVGK